MDIDARLMVRLPAAELDALYGQVPVGERSAFVRAAVAEALRQRVRFAAFEVSVQQAQAEEDRRAVERQTQLAEAESIRIERARRLQVGKKWQ